MHEVTHTIKIDKPPELVWEYLANPAKIPEWVSTCQECSHQSDGEVSLNSRITDVRNLLGQKIESVYEVTEHDFPRTLSTKVIEGPVPFRFTWSLSPAGAGTALTGKGVGEWSGPHDDPVVETAAQKNLEHDMETLKYLLETR